MSDKAFWHKRRVLITGGTGFIGSSLIPALLERQADIACLVRDSNRTHIALDLNRITLITGNLNDQKSIISAIQQHQPDIIFHLAGEAIQRDGKDYSANTEGTQNVLEAIQRHSPQTALVFTSSDSVYGTGLPDAFTENSIPAPQSPYAKSKYQAENLIIKYSAQHKLSTAIVRMSNVYGQGDMNFSHLIPGQIKKILSDEQPSLNSDGHSVYDFVYIEDITYGLILIGEDLLSKHHCAEIFNLSTGVSTSVIDTVSELLKITRKKDRILTSHQSHQISDTLRQSSPTKIKNMLGWQPLTDLSTGLKSTLKWYQKKLSKT